MRINDISGIYEIRNVVTGDFYIGSSRQCGKRFSTHYRELKLGIHDNPKLQNSWNKYGETNFYFSTLFECDIDSLFDVEQKYIDILNPTFNIAREVGTPNTPKAGTVEAKERSKKNLESRKNSIWCNSSEFHEMMSDVMVNRWKDPSYKELRSSNTKDLWNNPEYRNKQKHAHRKLNDADRLQIQEMRNQGYKLLDIASCFQVHYVTIRRVLAGLH